jgi:hypothetical protein
MAPAAAMAVTGTVTPAAAVTVTGTVTPTAAMAVAGAVAPAAAVTVTGAVTPTVVIAVVLLRQHASHRGLCLSGLGGGRSLGDPERGKREPAQ